MSMAQVKYQDIETVMDGVTIADAANATSDGIDLHKQGMNAVLIQVTNTDPGGAVSGDVAVSVLCSNDAGVKLDDNGIDNQGGTITPVNGQVGGKSFIVSGMPYCKVNVANASGQSLDITVTYRARRWHA